MREFLTDADFRAPVRFNGSEGADGQVALSRGAGVPPEWGPTPVDLSTIRKLEDVKWVWIKHGVLNDYDSTILGLAGEPDLDLGTGVLTATTNVQIPAPQAFDTISIAQSFPNDTSSIAAARTLFSGTAPFGLASDVPGGLAIGDRIFYGDPAGYFGMQAVYTIEDLGLNGVRPFKLKIVPELFPLEKMNVPYLVRTGENYTAFDVASRINIVATDFWTGSYSGPSVQFFWHAINISVEPQARIYDNLTGYDSISVGGSVVGGEFCVVASKNTSLVNCRDFVAPVAMGTVTGGWGYGSEPVGQASIQRARYVSSSTYNFALTDIRNLIYCTNGSPTTLTVPPDGVSGDSWDLFGRGYELKATQRGGIVTVNGGAGVTITGPTQTRGVGSTIRLVYIGGLAWISYVTPAPADLTKLDGIAPLATANASDAALRDRSTHTGTQAVGTITGLGGAATLDVGAVGGTVAAGNDSRFTDSREWTAATIGQVEAEEGTATTRRAFTAERVRQAIVAWWNTVSSTLAPKGLITSSGLTSNTARLLGRSTAATGNIEEITLGTNLSFSGNTLNAAGGSGSPGGSTTQVQYNNSGAFAGATAAEIENGILRLPAISTPSAPSAGGCKVFGRAIASRILPAFTGPSGLDSALQPLIARNKIGWAVPTGNATTINTMGIAALTAAGTATAANVATTNLYASLRRVEYLVTTAATTAVAGFRSNVAQFWRGNASGLGGFTLITRFGIATGTPSTQRLFVGMRGSTAAPTDVDPSTLTNIIGVGYDAADTELQIIHNDGSGTATKVPLGANFPKPTAERIDVYEIALFCAPNTSTVSWEVSRLNTAFSASGTISTDLPSSTTLLAPHAYRSVGGTSSIIGLTLMSLYVETDY